MIQIDRVGLNKLAGLGELDYWLALVANNAIDSNC